MQKIKKLCITAPKELSVQMDEIDEQNIPAGQFLIETIYSQVSAGTETACYRGMEAWFKLPGTPGYSCVGRVIAKAEDVTTVEPGDLVFTRGKHMSKQYVKLTDNYCKLPGDITERDLIVLDPMLATGGSASAAISFIKNRGCKSIRMMNLIAAPEGIERVRRDHPDVDVYVACVDEKLNDHGYIVPGLGDAGDRLFGTK